MVPIQEARWKITRPADVSWRDWDGLGAVYDDGSGDTHLMDALAIELLELLGNRVLSIGQLLDLLADATPELMDAETAAALFDRHLQSLAALNLVERADAPA